MKPFLARQGDVLVIGVDTIPDKATLILSQNGQIVLAEGETTGHCHAITMTDNNVELFAVANEVDHWLRVRSRSAELRHEEHGTITVPPGEYRVIRQREYYPREIRRVVD